MYLSNAPGYLDKLDLGQRLEFFGGLISSAALLWFMDEALATPIYGLTFLWLMVFMLRVNRRHRYSGSRLLQWVMADAFVLLLIHFLFAGVGLLPEPWMIGGLFGVPLLYLIFAGSLQGLAPIVEEHDIPVADLARRELGEARREAKRWRCHLGLHDWVPHEKLDELCFCDRCTKVAEHRFQGGHCVRCGISHRH